MLDLKIVPDQSTQEFLKECGPLLYQAEPVNSLMLGLLESLVSHPPKDAPLLLRIVENGKTVSGAVCFRANPMNLIITYATEPQLRMLCQCGGKHQSKGARPGKEILRSLHEHRKSDFQQDLSRNRISRSLRIQTLQFPLSK